jgi:hypothetical protein
MSADSCLSFCNLYYKTFYNRFYFYVSHLHTSLIFTCKVEAYPSGGLYSEGRLLAFPKILDKGVSD